jgi:glycosyltransferase involved in cell wall biosynthesis
VTEDWLNARARAAEDPDTEAIEPEVVDDPFISVDDLAKRAGIRSVEMLAWRDLDHPEAGGSEVHASRIAERWSGAGVDVTIIASRSPGAPRTGSLAGYNVERPAGRYSIFPVAAARNLTRRRVRPDATVEIWNGMPFFSPLWAGEPRMVFLHHVHGRMWDLVMPAPLAAVGRAIESRLAPGCYRGTPVVTLSESSREAIVSGLGMEASQVTVVPPGVDERFRPARRPEGDPLVVAVGRLVPYKRFDRLIEVLVRLRRLHPRLRAVVAGEGSERAGLESLVTAHDAGSWLSMPGRVDDDRLVDLYQRAWVVASASAYEGWGLTITEAAACGTPAIASPISGHLDGVSGLLAEPGEPMVEALDAVLSNDLLRHRLHAGALDYASKLTWDRTALESMRVLARQPTRAQRQ